MPEEKQNEDKLKTPKKTRDIAFNMLLLIIALIFSVLFVSFSASNSSSCVVSQSNESIAKHLLQSLQSGAAIYVAQQRTAPTSFNNFVVSEGSTTDAYTFSLDNIDTTEIIFNSNQLTITLAPTSDYNEEIKATYYLNGTDVTASFNFENDEGLGIDTFTLIASLFIIFTAIALLLFLDSFSLFKKLFKQN